MEHVNDSPAGVDAMALIGSYYPDVFQSELSEKADRAIFDAKKRNKWLTQWQINLKNGNQVLNFHEEMTRCGEFYLNVGVIKDFGAGTGPTINGDPCVDGRLEMFNTSSQYQRLVLERARVGKLLDVFILDPDGEVVYTNGNSLKVRDSKVYQSITELQHAPELETAYWKSHAIGPSGRVSYYNEMVLHRGRFIWVRSPTGSRA